MCGIVGYIGSQNSVPILLDGLARLEYRGYDSAGVAVLQDGCLEVRRCTGRLVNLEERVQKEPAAGAAGIGHTRWATHGAPCEKNSHPHLDSRGRIAVVHNGIIENYQSLRRELAARGHVFLSDTDTEVIPHLIEDELSAGADSLLDAIRRALLRTRGAYALGILSLDDPDTLYAARLGSPLIAGVGEGERYIASDVPAILNRTRRVVYLEDGQIAALRRDDMQVIDLHGASVPAPIQTVEFEAEAAERAGFETFMLKEIHEQPRVLRTLLNLYLNDDAQGLQDMLGFEPEYWRSLRRVMAISCGTAYHAALYGRLLLEGLTGVAVETDLGSEFRYSNRKIDPATLVIAVSQSGETADTLASVRMARARGCRLLSICNVAGSSLVRDSDHVIYTHAGPEIGVASTKAYTAQLMALSLLTLALGRARDEISPELAAGMISDLRTVPDAIHYVLLRADAIRQIAEKHHDGPSSLYLGRRYNYPTALEGALKNKEISYQHAEAYAAGEMKHGPIALINEYLPVICVCTHTRDEVYEKMISNMKEVEARNGRIIAIATDGDSHVAEIAEDVIYVPPIREEFSPMVNVVALQLLAYYAAQARGTDIDKPRNLAKSVTVE